MSKHNFIDIISRHKSANYQSIWIRNNNFMHYLLQQPSWIKYEKIANLYPLGTFSAFHYIIYTFLSGYKADHKKKLYLLSPNRPRKIAPTQNILLVFLKNIFFLFHVLRFNFSIFSVFSFKNAENSSQKQIGSY